MNRPEVYRGDTARRYFAMKTCERVGNPLEVSRPSLATLIWQLAPFIALALVGLAIFGRPA